VALRLVYLMLVRVLGWLALWGSRMLHMALTSSD
jgi:hypothetical protein